MPAYDEEQSPKTAETCEPIFNALNKALEIFVSYTEGVIDHVMSNGLRSVADAAGLDRIIIFRVLDLEKKTCGEAYRWDKIEGGTAPLDGSLAVLPMTTAVSRWLSLISKDVCVGLKRSEFKEDEAAFLTPRGVKSILIAPVFIECTLWGIVTFHDNTTERDFSENCIGLLRSAARLCASTIIREEMQQKVIDATVTKEADERTKIMLDATPLACRLWNKDFKIFDCNDETVKLFGLKNKQEYMSSHFELSPKFQPDGRRSSEKTIEILKKVFEEGRLTFEWMHQTAGGAPLPVEITLVRVKYRGDYIVAGYTRDLRETKALLNEIHDEKEKFKEAAHWHESILDALPFLVTVQDLDERFNFINAVAEATFGKLRHEMLGKPCCELGLSICKTENCAIMCAKRGRTRTYFTHDGTSYQADVKILKDLEDKNSGYIEIIQDITKMEHMARQQAEAQAANNAKSSFLAVMSHEMRTPMNAIMGMAAIGKNARDSSRKDYAFDQINEASAHLLGVISDILDISQIETDNLELVPAEFNLEAMMEKAVSMVRFKITEKRQGFFMELHKNVPVFVVGDEKRLTQVITNILSNAVKFTPESGHISLRAFLDSEEGGMCTIRFEVADDGIGISPHQQEKIFHAFEQADDGKTRRFGGIGLGLPISKRIIELMGGEISIDSQIGKGSRFIFTVRLLRDELEGFSSLDPHAMEEFADTGEFEGKRLLLAEDIDINREVFVSLLDGTGLIIDIAENGKEAVEKIAASPGKYDFVFMDLQMPEMDGLEATRRIRALPGDYAKKLPVIAMTANVYDSDVENCIAAGMNGHIGKPIDMDVVLEHLRKYL